MSGDPALYTSDTSNYRQGCSSRRSVERVLESAVGRDVEWRDAPRLRVGGLCVRELGGGGGAEAEEEEFRISGRSAGPLRLCEAGLQESNLTISHHSGLSLPR